MPEASYATSSRRSLAPPTPMLFLCMLKLLKRATDWLWRQIARTNKSAQHLILLELDKRGMT
jgi:hypothetical protein